MIDGTAFVNKHSPRAALTFGDYCEELKETLFQIGRHVSRLDTVFDIYKDGSLKLQTRENRGAGIRVSVRENSPVLKNFSIFMRNDLNKTELFKMISEKTRTFSAPIVISTILGEVVTNQPSFDTSPLSPCDHEEADTRLLLHELNGSSCGFKKISIITVDTDVVIISLYHFLSLNLDELWIEFGVGKNKRYLPIHTYAKNLSEEKCRALPFWFALTGCDTFSMFGGRGKVTAWNVWESFKEVTEPFVSLSDNNELSDEDFDHIQGFFVMLYDRTSPCTEANKCRRILFTKKQRSVESLPSTKNCLKLHVKRAMLQSSIWCSATKRNIPFKDYQKWS